MEQTVNINVTIPSEILLSLRVENTEFASQMKVITAIKLYENHKLSIGQAAALAGMHEEDFIKLLGRNMISIFSPVAEIAEDYANA